MEAKTNWILELVDHVSAPAKDIVRWTDKIADGFKDAYQDATKFNMLGDSFQQLSQSLSFGSEIADVDASIRQFVDGSESEIERLKDKVFLLGEVWDEPARDIARAANAMTKNMGGTFEQNLAEMEKGFIRGANVNENFVDTLKEYPATVKMGVEEMIATIIHANKQGVYSDKAIDSIKEATNSLLEMDKAQKDALKGIGIKPEDLLPKINSGNVMTAIKDISVAMNDTKLTASQSQKVIADIFKGAGEDAGGVKWVQSLAKMETDLDKIIVKETEWQRSNRELNMMFAEAKLAVFDVTKEYLPLIQATGAAAFVTANFIPALGAVGTMAGWVTGKLKWLFIGTETTASGFAMATTWIRTYTVALWTNSKALVVSGAQYIWAGATAIATYVSSLVTATAAQWGLNIAMNANPVGVIVVGVLALGAAVYGLIKYWDTVKEYLYDFGVAAVTWLNPLWWIMKAVEWIFPETFASIVDFFSKIWDWITKWIGKVWDGIKWLLDKIKAVLGWDEKTVTVEKKTKVEGEKSGGFLSDLKLHDPKALLEGDKKKNTKTNASGTSISGGSSGGRSVNMTLNISMQPTINHETDLQKLKQKLIDLIVDSGRDAGVTLASG